MRLTPELERLGIEQTPQNGNFCLDFAEYFPYVANNWKGGNNMRLIQELERLGIEQTPGMGIFCLDFAGYFPYVEQHLLDMDVSLSTEPMEEGRVHNLRWNGVLNHRYPNTNYVTLSQKFGRKVCKAGCIIQRFHEEFATWKYLNLTYGIGKSKPVRISIPISITTSDETPCVVIRAHFRIEEWDEWNMPDGMLPNLIIRVEEKQPDDRRETILYGTKDGNRRRNYVPLTPVTSMEEATQSDFIVCKETVELTGQCLEDVWVW